jgi:hypothetical protein
MSDLSKQNPAVHGGSINVASLLIADVMSEARLTYIDAIAIVSLFFIASALYRNRHPKDEQGRKQRRSSMLGVACVVLYALGRLVLILNSG